MSDASVIKEFLVQLGFKLDKNGQAQLQKGITGVTASAVALGEVMAKAAEAVGKAVVQMAQDLDQLYFTSRRVNASAENIKAFGFAIEQLGGSAQGAQSALEGIASFMRSNPGGERFINAMGVATRDANGQLRDTEKIAEDLGEKFKAMPFYMAKVRAALLGIDEKTLIALEQGPGPEADKYRDFASRLGLGMDAGADASNKFAEKVRDLKAEFGLLFVAGASRLLPMFQGLADWLSRVFVWFTSLKSSKLGQEFGVIATAAGQFIDAVVRLAGVIAKIVGPAFSVLINTSLKLLVDVLHIVTGLITGIADILTGKWGAAWKAAVNSVSGFVDTVKDLFGGLFGMISGLWKGFSGQGGPSVVPGAGPAPAGSLGANDNNPEGSSAGHVPLNVNKGLSAYQVGVGVRNFLRAKGLSFDKAEGIAAGVQAEGGTPTAFNGSGGGQGAFGIGQWRGDRLRELFARYGRNPSFAQQLDYLWSELSGGDAGGTSVLGASGSSATLRAYIENFMRPGNGTLGDLQRGGRYLNSFGGPGGVSMSQKTDIHISGVHEPVAAGRVVSASQERVNGNLVRNLKTAVA